MSPLYCLLVMGRFHLWATGDPQTLAVKSPKLVVWIRIKHYTIGKYFHFVSGAAYLLVSVTLFLLARLVTVYCKETQCTE